MKNWTSIGGMLAYILSPYRDFLLFAPYLDQALVSSTGITNGYVTDDRTVQLKGKRKREEYKSPDQIPNTRVVISMEPVQYTVEVTCRMRSGTKSEARSHAVRGKTSHHP